MIKNMFKRTWLSLKRKPNKSIVLVLIMFVMANLVLASLLIKNAVYESTETIKLSLGSEVYLSTDTTTLMQELQTSRAEQTESSDMSGGMSGDRGSMDKMSAFRPSISLDMVLDIADSSYLKDLTYSASSSAYAGDFSAVSEEESDSQFSNNPGRDFQSNRIVGDVMIYGINSYNYISEVQNSSMSLTDGTYFDESTDDQIIISYELADENSLVVGDFITLQNIESEEEVSLEIIGIFVTTDDGFENNIYMNVETAAAFFTSSQLTDDLEYIVSDVVYYLQNPDDVDAFIEEAYSKYPDMEEQYLVLDINNQAYEKMAGSIEQVGDFANTILIVVIFASVLIISLLINNNVKDRKYEIGVLRALGASKSNVAGQIFCELIITATIGFVLSFATSYYVADTLSASVLQNQLETSEIESEQSFGRPSSQSGMQSGMQGGMGNQTSTSNLDSDVEVIDEIDLSVSISSYLLLFAIGYTISFVAMIIPIINIVKYEPKTILTGRE